jgi:transposase-like protein
MFKQIRSMLDEKDSGPLGGKKSDGVEMDETYMGGVRKYDGGRKPKNPKTPVLGIAERKGRIRAFTTANVQSSTLFPIIREHVLPKSTVFTDERNIYDGLAYMTNGYNHRRIQHNERVYVMGDVHTNTVEGFWSLVKRGIGGVYHAVGRHYLQTYLNEYSFRYNRRFDEQPMFTSFLHQIEKRKSVAKPSLEPVQTSVE